MELPENEIIQQLKCISDALYERMANLYLNLDWNLYMMISGELEDLLNPYFNPYSPPKIDQKIFRQIMVDIEDIIFNHIRDDENAYILLGIVRKYKYTPFFEIYDLGLKK